MEDEKEIINNENKENSSSISDENHNFEQTRNSSVDVSNFDFEVKNANQVIKEKDTFDNDENKQNNLPQEAPKKPDIEIKYRRAIFHRRVLANVIDFLLCLLAFFVVFIASRAIVNSTPYFKTAEETIDEINIRSGLYVHTSDGNTKTISVVDFLDADTKKSAEEKVIQIEHYIDVFISYCDKKCEPGVSQVIHDRYDEYRRVVKLEGTEINYFIEKDGKFSYNPAIPNEHDGKKTYELFYEYVYVPFVLNDCQAFMVSSIPHYKEYQVAISNMIFFVELPVSLVLSTFLVYFVPPLCFRRNRQTIGKWAYRIGLVDGRCLSVKTGRIIARQLIVIILEIWLSIATLCVPVLISFSMMAFSKKRQSFCDYMLNTNEVDLSQNKIYYSKEEIFLESERKKNGPIDFKMAKENFK